MKIEIEVNAERYKKLNIKDPLKMLTQGLMQNLICDTCPINTSCIKDPKHTCYEKLYNYLKNGDNKK